MPPLYAEPDVQNQHSEVEGADDIDDILETDVLVVGGGTAGVMAAIGAADEAADDVLVERDNMLGGVGVCAGVHVCTTAVSEAFRIVSAGRFAS